MCLEKEFLSGYRYSSLRKSTSLQKNENFFWLHWQRSVLNIMKTELTKGLGWYPSLVGHYKFELLDETNFRRMDNFSLQSMLQTNFAGYLAKVHQPKKSYSSFLADSSYC